MKGYRRINGVEDEVVSGEYYYYVSTEWWW